MFSNPVQHRPNQIRPKKIIFARANHRFQASVINICLCNCYQLLLLQLQQAIDSWLIQKQKHDIKHTHTLTHKMQFCKTKASSCTTADFWEREMQKQKTVLFVCVTPKEKRELIRQIILLLYACVCSKFSIHIKANESVREWKKRRKMPLTFRGSKISPWFLAKRKDG